MDKLHERLLWLVRGGALPVMTGFGWLLAAWITFGDRWPSAPAVGSAQHLVEQAFDAVGPLGTLLSLTVVAYPVGSMLNGIVGVVLPDDPDRALTNPAQRRLLGSIVAAQLAPPVAMIILALGWRWSPWWLLGLLVPVALLIRSALLRRAALNSDPPAAQGGPVTHASRYLEAKDRLASTEGDTTVNRITALTDLGTIASESPDNRDRISELLVSFIRTRLEHGAPTSNGSRHPERLPADVAKALAALGRYPKPESRGGGQRYSLADLDLSNADLRRAHWQGFDLATAKLRDARLGNANLTGADLTGATLRSADLRDADLARADLTGATLSGADFRRADLERATLVDAEAVTAPQGQQQVSFAKARLKQADLTRADLNGADLERLKAPNATMTGTQLAGANLVGAELQGANLAGANLQKADLSKADLTGADLTGAHLHGATLHGTIFHKADLTSAVLIGAHLEEAEFDGAKLIEADLTKARLGSAKFPDADLTKARLTEAAAAGAILERASLADAELRDSNLNGVAFRGARLSGALLQGADLTDAILDGANLEGANALGANLTNTTLNNGQLKKAVLRDTVLVDTDFSHADLTEADLSGVVPRRARFVSTILTGTRVDEHVIAGLDLNQQQRNDLQPVADGRNHAG